MMMTMVMTFQRLQVAISVVHKRHNLSSSFCHPDFHPVNIQRASLIIPTNTIRSSPSVLLAHRRHHHPPTMLSTYRIHSQTLQRLSATRGLVEPVVVHRHRIRTMATDTDWNRTTMSLRIREAWTADIVPEWRRILATIARSHASISMLKLSLFSFTTKKKKNEQRNLTTVNYD